jgi:membrane protease YdiL (CAAX protease family)
MLAASSLIRRYPVASYFVLAYGLAWAGILVVVAPTGVPGSEEEVSRLFLLVFLANLAGPLFGAALVTCVIGGRTELGRLFSRCLQWRARPRDYALALSVAPLTAALVLFVFALSSPDFVPKILNAGQPVPIIAMGVLGGAAAGFIEEIGWTGLALHRLLPRAGATASALVVGGLHGVWHLAGGYWGEGLRYGALFPVYFLLLWIIGLVALRVLICALYARSHSLLLAQLAHASYTGSLFILWPATATPLQDMQWTAAFALTLLAVAAGVLLLVGPQSPVGRRSATSSTL